MISNRDGFVDFSKGLLILWVVQIHTVFWSGTTYIPDLARQLSLLIDVSLFFFISGYLTKVLDLKSLFHRSFKQFQNLYLEYLVFSFLILIPLWVFNFVKDKSFPDLPLAIISMLRIKPSGELWEDLAVYPGSLWYIAVYFSLLAVMPFGISLFGSRQSRVIVLSSVLTMFLISSYLGWNYPFLFSETIYVFFYLFIFLLGTAYKIDGKYFSIRYLKLAFIANITVCLLIFLFVMDGNLQLQSNKFQPSIAYLPYCLVLIIVFAIVRKVWNYGAISRRNQILEFLEWCGKNSYSIYLMQSVVCSIPGYFIPTLLNKGVPTLGIYIVTLLFNLSLTIILAYKWKHSKRIIGNLLTTVTSKSKTT